MRRSLVSGWTCCILFFLTEAPMRAEAPTPASNSERYYVAVFAVQDARGRPRNTHCFATFFRFELDPENGAPRLTSRFTISWMPARGSIRVFRRPECGTNYTYAQTVDWAAYRGLGLVCFGPYEIRRDGFMAAVRQWHRLHAGAIAYKALDRRFRPNSASNCVHALSDLAPGPLLFTGTSRGFSAGARIASHYRRIMIAPMQTHPWVNAYRG